MLSRCMIEIEKYTDPMNTPSNIDHCGEVMDAVASPFTQECVILLRFTPHSLIEVLVSMGNESV